MQKNFAINNIKASDMKLDFSNKHRSELRRFTREARIRRARAVEVHGLRLHSSVEVSWSQFTRPDFPISATFCFGKTH